jgi:hypothetical protein
VEISSDGSGHCAATKRGDGINGGVVYQWACGASNLFDQWS